MIRRAEQKSRYRETNEEARLEHEKAVCLVAQGLGMQYFVGKHSGFL